MDDFAGQRAALEQGTRRFGLWMAVVLAVVAAAPAIAGEVGYRLTPSGYQMPVYGSFLTVGDEGEVGVDCRRLAEVEIAAIDLDRLTRVRAASAWTTASVRADAAALEFEIRYTDPAGTGFDHPEQGPQRKAAMEAAMAAWSKVLVGSVKVSVEARFLETESADTLASAAPTDFVPIDSKLVPWSLAAQLAGQTQSDGRADLTIEFNPNIQWDYVVSGVNGEGTVSFVYTAIHEVGHGLGFLDSFDPETGALANALPTPYDVFISRGSGEANHLVLRSPDQVKEDVVSDDLFFAGPNSIAASQASIQPLPMIKLFAPNPYQQGSSVSHVDQETYSNVLTGLMVPSDFGPGFDRVDVLTLGIMADLGYQTDASGVAQAQ